MAKASSQMYLQLGRFANFLKLQVRLEMCEAPQALICKPKVSIFQRGQAIR